MPYRLVVFDFDGTLADTLSQAVATYNRIAPELGLRPITDVEAARAMPTRQLMRELGIRFWRLPRLIRTFRAVAAEHAPDVQLHAGIVELLHALRERGARLGILSSNSESNIRAALRANGVEDAFAFVVGYPKLFGKAKALRRILRQEKLLRHELLFIGDELRDIEAGQKVKVATAAVTWGFHAVDLMERANATYVLRHPAELLATLSELRGDGA
ncbi:MAG: HAD-IA family hydrolase [Bacteroidales bacterium]|nr:HAD-IA family hydrolase [Bacteroidales bacterium]